jgi:3-phytase
VAVAIIELSDLGGQPAPAPGARQLSALAETDPVPSGGDAADDVAIWVDRRRPRRSTVIGTDKEGGIALYDIDGTELDYRADGRINNVDLRGPDRPGTGEATIAAATNRTTGTVDLYRVEPRDGNLEPIRFRAPAPDLAVNGICMYRDRGPGRQLGLFVTGLRGEVEQWELTPRGAGYGAERVDAFRFESSAEACVVDERFERAYFAEERVGIWSVPLAGSSRMPKLIAPVSNDGPLVADVEGLAIADRSGGGGELIASSQGSNSYAVYRRDSGAYLGSFVVADGAIDGAEDTDGLDLTTEGLGPRFPGGLLVVQDGSNDDGNQNFKLVPLCREGVLSSCAGRRGGA